jgi:hypothetical protein
MSLHTVHVGYVGVNAMAGLPVQSVYRPRLIAICPRGYVLIKAMCVLIILIWIS